jgi:hypothetical protein
MIYITRDNITGRVIDSFSQRIVGDSGPVNDAPDFSGAPARIK